MPKPTIALLVWLAIVGILLGIPVGVSRLWARRDRRRIMADGMSAMALVTKIIASKGDASIVYFSFQPNGAAQAVEGQQLTSRAAIDRLRLMVGSTVQVHYLPKWSRSGFIPQLTYAERNPTEGDPRSNEPPLFYVSFGNRIVNPFRWVGSGDAQVIAQNLRIAAYRRRPFWFSQIERREFALSGIVDVEHHGAMLRLTVLDATGKPRAVQLQSVNAAQAEALTRLLPETKTAKFAPVLAERSEFDATLQKLTPKPYVTPALIAANSIMFLIALALGGGLLVPNPDVLIGLGTDYTPLTLGGQWWRLLTSVFLHFGLLHLAFNMWALYVNGRLAERIFGSVRYLVIYLVAGVTGSLASLLWHPLVNGAGASGAIFGVLGALLAFFIKKEGGVPASVTKAQLRIAMVFVAYSLLNGARYRGIDNAAHIGGLIGGFLLGYLLSRPLTADRDTQPWTRQWAVALGLCASLAALFAFLLSTGAVGPGYAHLPMHQPDMTVQVAPVATAPKHAPAATALPANGVDPVLAAMVAQESAKLDAKPKTVVVPSDQSYEALIAIRRGDYATANRIASEVLARSHLQRWRFYPFNEFMGSITRGGNDPVLLEHLRAWIRQEPKSAIAYLIRAEYYKQAAWTARGDAVANKVPPRLMDLFTEDLELATADVRMSISLNPAIPLSYFMLMGAVSGTGNTRALEAAFQAGIKAFPGYYELYRMRLYFLTPKWGGSVKGMYEFVEQYAGSAPNTSPLKFLYLHLYAYLLDAAAFDCGSLKGDNWQQCFDGEINGTDSPVLVDGTMKALNLYMVGDPVEFSAALWPVLGMIAESAGSSARVTALLQRAASVMGSDNRLLHEPGHNSYVLDDITARVWARMDNSANAEKKYLEALDDIEHTTFSDELQKAAARAWIYDDLARFTEDNHDYINSIAYQAAANGVGGDNHGDYPYRPCYAYFKLKYYAEAVSECTRQIESNGNYLQSHYWRARAYEGLGQWDLAMADFGPIADSSNNWFRDGAAIEMSLILGSKKNDVAAELALLNRYPYLFDPNLQRPDDLAVAFNNRCHAYMKLGLLKQALDDCNTSLKYGHIPDAIQKQQDLVKQLGVKAGT
jgi:membrane associated rhomboid family serine protease